MPPGEGVFLSWSFGQILGMAKPPMHPLFLDEMGHGMGRTEYSTPRKASPQEQSDRLRFWGSRGCFKRQMGVAVELLDV
jgi:hypothetical protein